MQPMVNLEKSKALRFLHKFLLLDFANLSNIDTRKIKQTD